jgi:uncharacterized membrane protein YkoI
MLRKITVTVTVTVTVIAASLATAAVIGYAANRKADNAVAHPIAKITLSQAIASAEQHAVGRATRAEVEHTKVGWAYDVEIVNGSNVIDVRVDADAVLSSAQDVPDREDKHDKVD